MTAYSDMLERFRRTHGDKFDMSDMDGRFAQFYGLETRIGVQWVDKDRTPDGPIEYGRVSITTGWRPCFLLMHRSSDHGSSTLLDDTMQIVKYKHAGAKAYRDLTAHEFAAWGSARQKVTA